MKLTLTRSVTSLLILTISFVILITSAKVIAKTTRIIVDVNNVLSDVSNNPVGMGVNLLRVEPDITISLKDLKIGALRFGMRGAMFNKHNPAKPKIAIRDPNHRLRKFVDADWNLYKTLSFDDFISICQSVGAEPFIVISEIDTIAYTGNEPHATPEEVLEATVEWVRYANIVKGYNVKYWEIGNENDIKNKLTNWTPEKYAETVVQFSRAMKAIDPSIKIGANGMATKKNNNDWWERIMPIIKDDVDFLITHQYSYMKEYQQWKDNVYAFNSHIEYASKAINTYNPALKLNVTEISSYRPGSKHQNNTWKMLHNFEVLGGALRYNEIDYILFWTSRSFDKDSSDKNAFNSNYELMPMGFPLKIWGNFLKKKMVYSSSKKTEPIRSWASYDPDDNSLNLFLLNKDEVSQDVTITLDNYTGSTQNERWVLKGSTPESTDITWEQSGSVSVNGSKIKIELEPLSVTIIALQ